MKWEDSYEWWFGINVIVAYLKKLSQHYDIS